jgi:uncharacterized membrane protein SpoIIM required for sporulation
MAQSIQEFIESRKPRWERLDKLIHTLERGKTRDLSSKDLLDVSRLYREATADLARLQAFRNGASPPDDLETNLNHLVARAHGQIYRNPSLSWQQLWRFLRETFPEAFQQTAPYILLALVVFLLGALYGFASTLRSEAFAPLLVPPTLIERVEAGEVWFDSILGVRPLASSVIMTNNISVSFLAFALGMTFGVGTTYILAFNGLLLGTLAGLCHIHGLDLAFWSFVLPHGVVELTAIFIAGGGGYVLASALIVPGDLPRKDALVQRGRRAIPLILGCVPLLIVAGVVEGFLSPAQLPNGVKFLLAGMLLGLLILYFLTGCSKSTE